MTMAHTYATGAATGNRAQYAAIGGTDSLYISAADTTGTVSVVADSSSYGANAIQVVTSATAGEAARLQVSGTNSSTEFRTHFIFDAPTISAGQWIDIANFYAGAVESKISINQQGAFQFTINGTMVYNSGTGKMPAAGTKVRVSIAMSLTTWIVALYDDSLGTVLATGNGTTAALSGTFGYLYLGKTSWQSATNVTVIFRAVRVESGAGSSQALLPAETALTPAKGSSIVPIRLISSTGSAPVPTGATAVTNLADGNTGTTVVLQAGSSIRFALRPLAVVSSDITFLLPAAFADSSTDLSVKLYKPGNTQVGTTKTATVGTSAGTASCTVLASELSGLATNDWEAMEVEIIVP